MDLFHAIRVDTSKIDYTFRRRGHQIEREMSVAKQEITSIIEWMFELSAGALLKPVQVEVEVMLSQTEIVELSSTLGREINFAITHASHHFAMAKVVASLRGIKADHQFGVAPSTASYVRAQ